MIGHRPTTLFTGAFTALLLAAGAVCAAAGGAVIVQASHQATVKQATALSATAAAARKKRKKPAPRIGTAVGHGFIDDNGTPANPSDDFLAAATVCPARSQVTGGGASDFTPDGVPVVSQPLGRRAWVAISTADPATANPADLEVYARCLNPRANVPNVTASLRQLPPSAARLAHRAARR